MTELQIFAKKCNDLVLSEPDWLCEFTAEWIDSDGHAKFILRGPKATATVEWSTESGFKINVIGSDIVYYERSRSVDTAEQAMGRVSTLLCE